MPIKQTLQKILAPFLRLRRRTKVIVLVSAFILLSYGLTFGIPKHVAFSYSGQDCARQLTLFPSVSKQVGVSDFTVEPQDFVKIAGKNVASLKTCVVPVNPPDEGHSIVRTSPFGTWLFAKQYSIDVGEKPKADITDFAGKTLPVSRPIEIALSAPDDIYDYKLKVNDKLVDCEHKSSKIFCAIVPLDLAQGEVFKATLYRYFDGKEVERIGGGDITTLKALTLVNYSVSGGQTVYDKPKSFFFEYDKTIENVDAELKIKNGDTYTAVESTASADDKKAIVTPKAELKRNAEYQLTLKSVESFDGSTLVEPYVLSFTMSGGPKVTGISVGNTGIARSGSIVVSFDQEIANTDAIAKLVTVQGIGAQISKSGTRLIFSYADAPLCGNLSISIKKGLESQYGVAQTDDWNFSGRTLCYTTSTFGTSVKGRAMVAYTFGAGPKTILFTGAIHGNEQSARLLMNAWISELDANAQNIPSGVRIVVVPSVNPDGVAANNRYNANDIDLNRNYNVSDWKTDIETVNGDPKPGGGGPTPGSEPETQAMMALTQQLSPYLTMSYHSSASYAIGNTCGGSTGLADTYAKLTGYRNMTGVSGAFSYQITGTYDDWICERLGLASVLIELATSTSSEFTRNKTALWAMAKS